jgi:hypothetical protein
MELTEYIVRGKNLDTHRDIKRVIKAESEEAAVRIFHATKGKRLLADRVTKRYE